MRRWALVAALASGCSTHGDPVVSTAEAGLNGVDSGGSDGAAPCGAFGCFDSGPPETPLALQARKTLQGCGGIEYCHANGAGGMTLMGGGVFDATIGVQSVERPELLRVHPGEPLLSYVFLKVWCDGGIEGGCMGGGTNVAQVFYDWIEAGAPTN